MSRFTKKTTFSLYCFNQVALDLLPSLRWYRHSVNEDKHLFCNKCHIPDMIAYISLYRGIYFFTTSETEISCRKVIMKI